MFFGGKAAIDTWIEETVALCRERCEFLLDLTEAERDFLDGGLARGEVNSDLLDTSSDLRARISAMPMLAWKCQNVHRHQDPDHYNKTSLA